MYVSAQAFFNFALISQILLFFYSFCPHHVEMESVCFDDY